MTLEQKLAELRKVCEAATPGPWIPRVVDKEMWAVDQAGVNRRHSTFLYPAGPFYKYDGQELIRSTSQTFKDSEFIARCNPTQVLRLLRALEIGLEYMDGHQCIHEHRMDDEQECDTLARAEIAKEIES